METPELNSYINTERAKKTPDSVIKTNLLANGWSENDIAGAMNTGTITKTEFTPLELKNFKRQETLKNFCILLGFDSLIIVGFKFFFNNWGLFGISIPSILLRVIVIYAVSSFVSRGSTKPEKITFKYVLILIFKTITAIILTWLIFIGILFAYCAFGGMKF